MSIKVPSYRGVVEDAMKNFETPEEPENEDGEGSEEETEEEED